MRIYFEIMFRDLTPEAQDRYLKAMGVNKVDLNLDFPLAIEEWDEAVDETSTEEKPL